MIALLPLLFPCLVSGAAPEFVESRIDAGARVIGFECPDIDDDKRGDLVLLTADRGRRALLWYRQRDGYAFPAEPDWRWTVPDEVVAYAFADVRDEPGLELLLFSRSGVHSVSTTQASVRGNLRREIEAPFFPEVADPGRLPRFDWIVDLDGDGRDELLLPTEGTLLVYARAAAAPATATEPAGAYAVTDRLTLRAREPRASGNIRVRIGSASVETEMRLLPVTMFPQAPTTFPLVETDRMLSQSLTFDLPALVDFDGDGVKDAVTLADGEVRVRRGLRGDGGVGTEGGARFAAEPLAPLRVVEEDADVRLLDLDGDGRPEVVVTESSGDGTSKEYALKVLPRSADGGVESEPAALLKFQGSQVDFAFVDVNRDAWLDLVVTRLDLPSGLQSLTTVHLDTSIQVYLGGPGATLARKPDARFDRRLRPEQLKRIFESFVQDLNGDYDGDGWNDLLTIRDDGLIQIRALRASGGGVAFADEPMSVYQTARPVRAALPCWISRDTVSDLVLRHEDGLTVFVSVERAR